MSHLLSSVNADAAERLEDISASVPDVGMVVVYMARPGLQRMGRREFPAFVLGHDKDGFLDLFVLMEPEDMIMENHVRPFEVYEGVDRNQVGHLWRHVEEDVPQDVAELQVHVAKQADEIAELRKLIIGDYKAAALPVYDILKDFEDRLVEALPKGGKR